MVPPEIQALYRKILQDAAKEANKELRREFLNREYGQQGSVTKSMNKMAQESLAIFNMGWNPLRANPRGASGLGFTLSDIDVYRLRNDGEMVNKIATNCTRAAINKHAKDFMAVFLQDVLITTQDESFYDPPTWDDRSSRYRDILGRFSKKKF